MRYFIMYWSHSKTWVSSISNDKNGTMNGGFTDINETYKRCAEMNDNGCQMYYVVREDGQTLSPLKDLQ